MERLPGLLGGEPVYWLERIEAQRDGTLETELGFSDVAAHPYEALVAATVDVLAAVPGVLDVQHTDREVVRVRSRGVDPEVLAGAVDRFWFDRLATALVDPSFGLDPAEVLASPWPVTPPPPTGQVPQVQPADGPTLRDLREAVTLPPSRRRLWTYLAFGAVPAAGGVALALAPGGSNGVLLMAVGALNLAVAARIARRRRTLVGQPTS